MKKLRGLGNKNYNVLFHTHTVAGIVISFALFVIFYAGAFSLFRDQVDQWENPDLRQPVKENLDLDKALALVDSTYEGLNYHQNTNITFPREGSPLMYVYGAVNKTDSTTERMAAYINPTTLEVQNVRDPNTTVNDTIYVLHYFGQIPVIGLYLSGLVALFFLFAIVSGILIHWQNLLTKFYAIIKEGKWKTIWTNAHTVLGVIGLPFQVLYAVTGAFFGLLILILIPAAYLLYDGDQEKLVSKVNPAAELKVEEDAPDYEHIGLNELYKQVKQAYPTYEIINVNTRNYGKEDALAFWNIDDHQGINSSGSLAMRMKDGIILTEYSTLPNDKGYNMSVIGYIFKLHFASFGGFTMRIIYFVLAMITCFMIISGVLIWRTARDNNKYTLKQRLFHHRVTKWYMAICLSMFPAFAIIFLANKLIPMEMVGRVDLVNQIFFLSWLGLTLLGLFWNKYSQQNRNYLIIGGILAILIPIMNGIATDGWIWKVWNSYPWVAYVDLFWLVAGVVSLYLSFFVLKVKETTDIPQPLEMKSGKTVSEQPERIMVPKPSLKRPTLKPELAINGLKDSISEN
ncbi:MAG: PepSY-associated TM helix domain-containing protein [Bacteroidota bacterium]